MKKIMFFLFAVAFAVTGAVVTNAGNKGAALFTAYEQLSPGSCQTVDVTGCVEGASNPCVIGKIINRDNCSVPLGRQ